MDLHLIVGGLLTKNNTGITQYMSTAFYQKIRRRYTVRVGDGNTNTHVCKKNCRSLRILLKQTSTTKEQRGLNRRNTP